MSDDSNSNKSNQLPTEQFIETTKKALKIKESYDVKINKSIISDKSLNYNFNQKEGDEIILFELPKDFNLETFKEAKFKNLSSNKIRKINNKYCARFSNDIRELSTALILNNFKDKSSSTPSFLEINKFVKIFEFYDNKYTSYDNIKNRQNNIIPRRLISRNKK